MKLGSIEVELLAIEVRPWDLKFRLGFEASWGSDAKNRCVRGCWARLDT